MTGPADDAELVVKMMNSGAPGVMLDLEDSTVNEWEHQQLGQANILSALRGSLTYFDKKRDSVVGIKPSATVIWIRPRGLHISQDGVSGDRTSASLFDVASIAFRVDASELNILLRSTSQNQSRRKRRYGGAMYFRRLRKCGVGPAITSSAWHSLNRIRWHFRWRNFCLICAITLLA